MIFVCLQVIFLVWISTWTPFEGLDLSRFNAVGDRLVMQQQIAGLRQGRRIAWRSDSFRALEKEETPKRTAAHLFIDFIDFLFSSKFSSELSSASE